MENSSSAQEREIRVFGNTRVELRKDGLTLTVREGEEPTLTPADIGVYFKRLREDAGLTLEEVAKATEVEVIHLKAIEKYGLMYKDREFYNLCHLFQKDSGRIAKKYCMPLNHWEIQAKLRENEYKAREAEKRTENQAEAAPAKPDRQYPVRAMFISLLLINVATLLLCAGQMLMRLVG